MKKKSLIILYSDINIADILDSELSIRKKITLAENLYNSIGPTRSRSSETKSFTVKHSSVKLTVKLWYSEIAMASSIIK